MHRETRFLISRGLYAIDLATITGTQHPRGDRIAFTGQANAVWYRRQGGVTRACIGDLKLWSHYLPRLLDLDDPLDVLGADLDGRYGGDCHGRWDGQRYWGAQEPEVMERHLSVLRPMLDAFPTVPEGYDGWWTFQPPRTGRS
ncbi:hypothetical protein HNR23_002292 [Nocardiopsis mwathae]|uniref:Uncharacterized protein n=1 Tax=Nocardiopsis mwathae TaxID=1472723 RepID=A0A7X0D5C1_9ACTN|nr:hypothetical protein [Nocardiopsis mwathae]MBB6172232.1 hypothetical protein [Nocardiopsis mwathae]